MIVKEEEKKVEKKSEKVKDSDDDDDDAFELPSKFKKKSNVNESSLERKIRKNKVLTGEDSLKVLYKDHGAL